METLGGKTSLGTSKVVAEEQAAFVLYRDKVLAIGPIDSEEKAAAYREILKDYMPAVRDFCKNDPFFR